MSRLIVVVTAVVLACLTGPAASATPVSDVVGTAPRDLALPGPYAVASTAQIVPCTGPGADEQNADARRQGARTPLQCTTTAPMSDGPETSVDYWYPIVSGPSPLVVFVPGNEANPGYFSRLAHHWASYGFVVAIATIRHEVLPQSPFLGVRRALSANSDRQSPLFGRIDTRSVILAGHSAGATKAIEAAGLVGAAHRGLPVPPDLRLPSATSLRAVLAIQPDVYTVTAGVEAPTFTVTGDADQTSRPGPIGTIVQDRIDGPAWFAVARGAPHLVTVDPVSTIPFARAVVAFLLASTGDPDGCRAFVGPRWSLGADPTFVHAVRNRAAAAASCPAGVRR